MKYLSLLFLFIVASCSAQEIPIRIVNFDYKKEIVLPRKERQHPFPYAPQYRYEGGKNLLTFYNYEFGELLTYNLDTRKIVEEVPLKFGWKDDVWAFNYFSGDSIFVLYNGASRKRYNHDSTLIRVNKKGELLDAYSFKDAPVWCTENPRYPEDSVGYVATMKLGVDKEHIYLPLPRYKNGLGDTSFHENSIPISGHIHTQQNKFYPHTIGYPIEQQGLYYPKDIERFTMTPISSDKVVYSFYPFANLYEYNTYTREVYTHLAKSYFIDSIIPFTEYLPKSSSRPREDPKQGRYWELIYDPYKELYYRFVTIPYKNTLGTRHTMIVLDKNFKKIGEGIVPKSMGAHCLPTPGGLLLLDGTKTKNAGIGIVFKLFTISYEESTMSQLKEKLHQERDTHIIKEGGLPTYFKDIHSIRPKDAMVLFFPLDRSCESCSIQLMNYYKNNYTAFKKNKLYFLFAADAKSIIDHKMSIADLPPNLPHLYTDTRAAYTKYVSDTHAKAFTYEKGKIIRETDINPQTLFSIIHTLNKYKDTP